MTSPTFRDRLASFVPRWLKRGTAAKLLYAFGVHFDLVGDLLVEAVRKRFPEPNSYDALPYIGADRKIIRGPNEPSDVYASRLATWLDAHRLRGNPYVLLEQLYLYYAPNNFPIELVYASSGLQFSLAVDGTITYAFTAWREPDGDLARWARWRLFYHWPVPIPPAGQWDSLTETWDLPATLWDSGLSAEQAAEVLAVPQAWNAAHCLGTVVLLSPGAELWDFPASTWDDGGTWDGAGDIVFLTIS